MEETLTLSLVQSLSKSDMLLLIHSQRADSTDFFSERFSSSRVRWGNLGLRGNMGLFAFSLLKRS